VHGRSENLLNLCHDAINVRDPALHTEKLAPNAVLLRSSGLVYRPAVDFGHGFSER